MTESFDHKLNTIKWVGIITMTIDHIGYYLFPSLLFLRIIGRIAFPCFLYSTIDGTQRTHNYKTYIFHLVLLGILSMPITPNTFNVLFLLVLFSLSVKYKQYTVVFGLMSFFVEYSIYGFLFGWCIYWLREKDQAVGVLLSSSVQFIFGLSIQAFSLLALPLFLSKEGLTLPKLPRYFFYIYYPLHQLVLTLIALNMTV